MEKTYHTDKNSIISGLMRRVLGTKASNIIHIKENGKTYSGIGTSKSQANNRANKKHHKDK
jgi:hypothetical protein